MVQENLIKKTCDSILNHVKSSPLNFSIQETPYSCYITIRKSFNKNFLYQTDLSEASSRTQLKDDLIDSSEELAKLRNKITNLEAANDTLVKDYEDEVVLNEKLKSLVANFETKMKENEAKIVTKVKLDEKTVNNEVVRNLKDYNSKLVENLENVEKSLKTVNKQIKAKDKELYDLKKENSILTENFLEVKSKFTNLSTSVNKEKKQEAKRIKKQEKKDFMNNLKAESQTFNFECDKCDKIFDSLSSFRIHAGSFHVVQNSSQTEEKNIVERALQVESRYFTREKLCQTIEENYDELKTKSEPYSCFFCDKTIESEEDLNEHRKKCRGSTRLFCSAPLGLPEFSSLKTKFSFSSSSSRTSSYQGFRF